MYKPFVIGLFAIIFLSGCIDPLQNPADILESSQKKLEALSYIVEYNTQTETIINSRPLKQEFRLVELKKGSNKKTSLYANEIVLLQEFIESEFGQFLCVYGEKIENVTCLVLDKQTSVSQIDGVKKLSELGVLSVKMSDKTISIGNKARQCYNLEYELNLKELKNQTAKEILQFISQTYTIEDEETPSFDSITELKSNTCLDKETGIPLELSSTVGYQVEGFLGKASFKQKTKQNAVLIQINPLISQVEFNLPKDTDIELLPEEGLL